MKRILLGAIFLIASFGMLNASHYSSGYINLKYVGTYTGSTFDYEVTIYFVRDNSGATISLGDQDIFIQQCNNSQASLYRIPKLIASFNEGSPNDAYGGFRIPNYGTCNGIRDAYSLHMYRDTIKIDSTICFDQLTVFCAPACCRAGTDNLASAPNLYLEATLNLSNGQRPSTPTPLFNELVREACLNVPQKRYVLANSSDSTSIAFTNPLEGSDYSSKTAILYNNGYSQYVPFGSLTPTSINNQEKTLNFLPGMVGSFNTSLRLSSFESVNGTYQLGATSALEFTTVITSTCSSLPWEFIKLDKSSNGTSELTANCGDTILYIETSRLIDANTLASDASEFALTNSLNNLIPITQAEVLDTDTSVIALYLQSPIAYNDTLMLTTRMGVDGNTILDLCGSEVPEFYSTEIFVSNCTTGIGVMDFTANFELYPNPAKNVLHLTFKNQSPSRVLYILNLQGKVVMKKEVSDIVNTINISQLPEGVYIASVDGSVSKHVKFIKD